MRSAFCFLCSVACLGQAPTPSVPAPQRFKTVIIKPCGAGGSTPSARNLSLYCRSVHDLIDLAFIAYKDGRLEIPALRPEIEGLPAWAESDHFDIDATTDADTAPAIMNGPLLKSLLEDRFKLKIRDEARPGPAFALVIAPGGPKLQPSIPESCPPQGCKSVSIRSQNVLLTSPKTTLDQFCKLLSMVLMLPVVNRTGIEGIFDFQTEFAPDEATPDLPVRGRPASTAPSLFTVLEQQFGLAFEPTRADYQYLVVEHVEKPK